MQPGLLHGQMLHAVQFFHLELPQHRTHLAPDDRVIRFFGCQPRDHLARGLIQLANLLFHRHLLQQGFGASVRVNRILS